MTAQRAMGLLDETRDVRALGYVTLHGYGPTLQRAHLLGQLLGRRLSLEPIDGYVRPFACQRQDGCSTDALLGTRNQRAFSLETHGASPLDIATAPTPAIMAASRANGRPLPIFAIVGHSRMIVTKLLIANRGEIAIRIARAAADLGLPTVAVYSEDDARSLHLRVADEVRALPGRGAAAYLDGRAIIAAAVAPAATRSIPATASSPSVPISPGPAPRRG